MYLEINYSAYEITFIGYETYTLNEVGILISFRDSSGFIDKKEFKIKDKPEFIFFENDGYKCIRLKFLDKQSVSRVLENTFRSFYMKA